MRNTYGKRRGRGSRGRRRSSRRGGIKRQRLSRSPGKVGYRL